MGARDVKVESVAKWLIYARSVGGLSFPESLACAIFSKGWPVFEIKVGLEHGLLNNDSKSQVGWIVAINHDKITRFEAVNNLGIRVNMLSSKLSMRCPTNGQVVQCRQVHTWVDPRQTWELYELNIYMLFIFKYM